MLLGIAAGYVALRANLQRKQCFNQLAALSMAARLFSNDHEGRHPQNFADMAEEVSTPRLLHCPSDRARVEIRSWADFTPGDSSYEIIIGDSVTNVPAAFARCRIHGHIAYTDGSIRKGAQR